MLKTKVLKVLKGGGCFTFLYITLDERDFHYNTSGVNKVGFRIKFTFNDKNT